MKTRLLLVICTEGLKLTFISIQSGSIQSGSFLLWDWIRLQIGNDSNGCKKKDWKRLLVLHLFSRFAKKRLETAAGIAPFFQICKKKKGLETAAGIAPFF